MTRRWMALARRAVPLGGLPRRRPQMSEEFWSVYNETEHRRFRNREDSLRHFGWRSEQYFDYLDHLPLKGRDGKVILDYGCGPGHDLVRLVKYSKPARLIGMEVSDASLREADERLALRGAQPEDNEAFLRRGVDICVG